MTSHPLENSEGYTVIEVLSVIVIAALLAVAFFAYYRHSDTDLISQTNILKTHIRYAQSRAINTDTAWGVRYESGQRAYWLFKAPNTNQAIALPGQTDNLVGLEEAGLDITGATFNITFDSWGQPTLTARTFTDGQLSIYLNRNGVDGDPITLTENTGFIP